MDRRSFLAAAGSVVVVPLIPFDAAPEPVPPTVDVCGCEPPAPDAYSWTITSGDGRELASGPAELSCCDGGFVLHCS